MFDTYSLKARYYPVVILFLPVIVLGVFYSLRYESPLHFLGSLGVVGALTYLFSQLGRDQGKQREPKLWRSWDGAPTTQLLRLRDQHIDEHTKQRYHQKLQSLFPVLIVPDATMEVNDPDAADNVYSAWTKYLISQTRDIKKFSLLFKENTSYGFRRNLWGLRSFALIFTIIVMISNYFFWGFKLKIFNPFLLPTSFIYATIALVIIFLFWLLIVTKSWVKLVAFSYAVRLCESVENI